MSYKSDRQWSDRFLPRIKQIVGPLLLEPSAFDVDVQEATDLIVMCASDMRIAARVRRHGYYARYPNQFTLRARRDTGAKTELSKIIDGWGDWLFYGHADLSQSDVEHWMIVDLHAFRAALIRDKSALMYGDKPNGDGTYFKWFDVASFKPSILIASNCALRQVAA